MTATILDLPLELLDCILLDTIGDQNITLKSVCLAGSPLLTRVARRLTFRELYISLQFPLDDTHLFYKVFRSIVSTPSLRASVRAITFTCRGRPESLKFMQLMTKQFPKLVGLERAYLHCGSRVDCELSCVTSAALHPLLSMPSLQSIQIHGCHDLSTDYFPVGPTTYSLRELTIRESVFGKSREYFTNRIEGLEKLRLIDVAREVEFDDDTTATLCSVFGFSLPLEWTGNVRNLRLASSCSPQCWLETLEDLCKCDSPETEDIVLVNMNSHAVPVEWDTLAITISAMIADNFGRTLRRLAILSPPSEMFDLLMPIDTSDFSHTDMFTGLTHFAFTIDGFLEDGVVFYLTHLPALKHLFILCRNSDGTGDEATNKLLASRISTLESVTWIASKSTFLVKREGPRNIVSKSKSIFSTPAWLGIDTL